MSTPITAPAIAASACTLLQRYQHTRQTTLELTQPLSSEDCVVQSMPDASPVKWHLAHTTWFFETFVLTQANPAYCVFDPAFKVLFNSYYNGVGDKHPRAQRGLITRPGLQDILNYRQHVDAAMTELLAAPACPTKARELIGLGIEHEQQHQELILTDVKHLLSCNPAAPLYAKRWPLQPVALCPLQWRSFEGGLTSIGHAGDGFHFDNETPQHQVWLEPFQIASRPVSHGDFLQFMSDGGYERPELWLSAGWDTVQSRGWQAPMYWTLEAGQWHTFTLHGRVPVDPNTPVCHLSFYEAEAYARWANARLPTEAEWEVAAQQADVSQGNFLESRALHPMPHAQGELSSAQPASLRKMFGDVWEWTRSEYAPYPGFRTPEGAVGEYNGKFMCNQYVLRGGSCVTPRAHIRPTYRNFFPADARWQFSGVRLAR
jgi:ergothioneine biosynthesis protein EgtB